MKKYDDRYLDGRVSYGANGAYKYPQRVNGGPGIDGLLVLGLIILGLAALVYFL